MSGEEEGSDELNVLSDSFDALAALYSNKIIVPWKKAPAFDNIAKYEVLTGKSDGSVSLDKVATKVVQEMKKKKDVPSEPFERQLPLLKAKEKDSEEEEAEDDNLRKKYENVLTLTDKAEGPLGFLKDCMHHRIRVKVWTRDRASMRGFSQGFVLAFDKYWNIALEDVTEVWTRSIKRKTVPMGTESEPPPEWKIKGPPLLPPHIEVVKKDKKTETCRRHVRQILIRGEQVVLISVVSSKTPHCDSHFSESI